MNKGSKKIQLIRLRTHERVRELIILRLKIMNQEKKLINKTFLHLLLPSNYYLSLKILYKTVDEIWFLAGDNSSDFNYYTKRSILASIYTSTMIHFTNNEKINESINIIDKQLKVVSGIPKLKNKVNDFITISSKFLKLRKFFFIKQ